MVRADGRLHDVQRAPEMGIGIVIPPHFAIDDAKAIQGWRETWVLRAQRPFRDRQRPLVDGLGLGVAAVGAVDFRQVVQGGRQARVLVIPVWGGATSLAAKV